MLKRSSMLFPELAHFPTRRERIAALNVAFASVPAFLAMVLLILAGAVAMSFTLDICVLRPLGLPPTVEWAAVLASTFLVTVLASFASVGGYVQRQLRLQLKDRGIHLCIACGYNLKGVESGRCPECGDSDSAKTRYPLAVRIVLWAGVIFAAAELFFFFPLAAIAGRFEWTHGPGLFCWLIAGLYCASRLRSSRRVRRC